jgi:hypothetical protein
MDTKDTKKTIFETFVSFVSFVSFVPLRVMTIAAVLLPSTSFTQTPARNGGELVERTLAIVAGNAITLSDVRAATALGLVAKATDVDAATEALVERALKLREVERYAPPEPDAARIDAAIAEIRDRLGPQQVETVLAASGMTEARLRTWIRDDLRITTYLNQRFAADGPERRDSLVSDWVADLRRRTPIVWVK